MYKCWWIRRGWPKGFTKTGFVGINVRVYKFCWSCLQWPEGFKKTGFVRIKALSWAETLSSYALFTMQDYFTGVWGLSFTNASGILNIWGGITQVLPVFFLFLVDTLLGHFKMLAISSISYCVGMSLLAMSMLPPIATTSESCNGYNSECIGHTPEVFFIGMVLLAIGRAGNAVSEEPFREAQDCGSHSTTKLLLRIHGFIIVLLVPIIGAIALPYVQPWTLRFGIPALCTVFATLIFMTGWCGPRKYKKDSPDPDGSPITNVCRVFVAAASKMCTSFPDDGNEYHRNDENEELTPTRFLSCLHKAAIIPDGVDPTEHKWKVCSVGEVEEAKTAVRMVPIMMTFLICGILSSVADTYFVEQAQSMNSRVGEWKIPTQIFLLVFNCSKAGFSKLACVILQKEKREEGETNQEYKTRAIGKYSRYKKVAPAIGIGVGMVFSVLCCITAAKVEERRLGVVDLLGEDAAEEVTMSMFWLVFQFILLAGMDSFLEKSASEFYTYQSPESMEDYLDYFGGGVFGLGFLFSTLFVFVVEVILEKEDEPSWFQESLNKSRLDLYYWFLAGLSSANLLVFIFVAYYFRYKNLEPQNNEANTSSGGGDRQSNLEPVVLSHL